MNKTIAIVAVTLSLTASAAVAGERGGDAALGAISGAVVLGPVGAVAGALVGYTAGPSIAHSWGLRRSGNAHHAPRSARYDARTAPGGNQLAQGTQAQEPATTQSVPAAHSAAPAAPAAQSAPPVQTLE